MKPFNIESAAVKELFEAVCFYNDQEPELGGRFFDAVNDAISAIRKSPLLWRETRKGIRRYILYKFPFSIIYHYDGRSVIILAFKHHKRDIAFLKSRIPPFKT
jgi:hypothetical protein